jgi:hypothetical protein
MIRRVIAFDLDNTLADSKSPISGEIAGLLDRLLARFQVSVISGGKFEQFEAQLIDHLSVAPDKLGALHVMPMCGTGTTDSTSQPGRGSRCMPGSPGRQESDDRRRSQQRGGCTRFSRHEALGRTD